LAQTIENAQARETWLLKDASLEQRCSKLAFFVFHSKALGSGHGGSGPRNLAFLAFKKASFEQRCSKHAFIVFHSAPLGSGHGECSGQRNLAFFGFNTVCFFWLLKKASLEQPLKIYAFLAQSKVEAKKKNNEK